MRTMMPKHWKRMFLTFCCVIACLCQVLAGTNARAQQRPKRQIAARPLTARQIAARVLPSVVLVTTACADTGEVSYGSGFVIRPGLVATNKHVVECGTASRVKPGGASAERAVASRWLDPERDLALLHVPSLTAPPLPLADTSLLAVGDDIYAAGNPRGFEGTFTRGVVSAIRARDELVQFDAPISPGSSGGPVVDARGRVVAITTALHRDAQNLNFAIPSGLLVPLLKRAAKGESPSSSSPRAETARTDAVATTPTVSGSPAVRDALFALFRDNKYPDPRAAHEIARDYLVRFGADARATELRRFITVYDAAGDDGKYKSSRARMSELLRAKRYDEGFALARQLLATAPDSLLLHQEVARAAYVSGVAGTEWEDAARQAAERALRLMEEGATHEQGVPLRYRERWLGWMHYYQGLFTLRLNPQAAAAHFARARASDAIFRDIQPDGALRAPTATGSWDANAPERPATTDRSDSGGSVASGTPVPFPCRGEVEVGSLVERATQRVAPSYSAKARTARVGGIVTVHFVIDSQGTVREVRRTTGPELLRRAAEDAVRRWRFRAPVVDGQATCAAGFVSFNFEP